MAISELDAVNRILMLTGEAPVSSLATPRSSTVAAARQALEFARKQLTANREFWNTETRTITPSEDDDYAVRFGPEVHTVLPRRAEDPDARGRWTLRGDQLWDVIENTGRLEGYGTFYVNVVRDFAFEQLEQPVRLMVQADALRAVAAMNGDQNVMNIADREWAQANLNYKRFLWSPGRLNMLRDIDQQPVYRALR